ncbi:aconitate hydratase AcnA [Pelistega sp. MC2]|uniref:aconitate hydratase AcnA n=1 Tax=Pelistega sp. MC2 TaxID=1720297 RepID=UPI000B1B66F3|nr:aconitate hydratase AcnA [Pelistega sp. MC2]
MLAQQTLKQFSIGDKTGQLYSLPTLAKQLNISLSHLPVSIRIVLETLLRHQDNVKITDEHIKALATWEPNAKRTEEIPFIVARVVLQDFTGVPLLADLAAMRTVAENMGKDPKRIEPLVPVDLVVDHSVMIDYYGTKESLDLNMKLEFQRNKERYQFMKWGMQAFDTFGVVPPGFGIVHQVNLEYLAPGVHKTKDGIYYPDSLVGTDSHTTMINGVGVVGWGVGGIEAEAGMLGQPVYFLTPDVVGVELTGQLKPGVTATDLVLTLTELLRREKVVGKFVEFCGEGTASINVPNRATIANMAPEYGATMGFFPVDDKTIEYFKGTGRSDEAIEAFKAYFQAQELYGIPRANDINYTKLLHLDLSSIEPSVAGPKRPQDRIVLPNIKSTFEQLFTAPIQNNGFNQDVAALDKTYTAQNGIEIKQGDILIAAITSCTNTSNPSVLLAAGLLAKKAVEAGLQIKPHIKTSLAPGSRVVTEYLEKTGLLPYLEQLGFDISAYGCTTCIGNAGDLLPEFNQLITENNLVCSAILSGNRNFEARIHPNIKANFLASPPLVVAYALAGNIRKNLTVEPIAINKEGKAIYLQDIWPSNEEIQALLPQAMEPTVYRQNYEQIKTNPGELWKRIEGVTGNVYNWPESTYIAKPPFFDQFSMTPGSIPSIKQARILGIFGDSVTTDHISPAGSIKETSPAGQWLIQHDISKGDFNSYGSRRGNHEVMIRGTFANVRIKNLMIPPKADGSLVEGGETIYQPTGEQVSIFDAAMRYISHNTPTVIFAGEEYGTGSSRDWAAKGTQLLGVKAVIARSFERIHRNNLVGMGVLPLQFKGDDSISKLGITGNEVIDISGLENGIQAQQDVVLTIHRADGTSTQVTVLLRIDTPIEVEYYQHGGILPFVLRQLLA